MMNIIANEAQMRILEWSRQDDPSIIPMELIRLFSQQSDNVIPVLEKMICKARQTSQFVNLLSLISKLAVFEGKFPYSNGRTKKIYEYLFQKVKSDLYIREYQRLHIIQCLAVLLLHREMEYNYIQLIDTIYQALKNPPIRYSITEEKSVLSLFEVLNILFEIVNKHQKYFSKNLILDKGFKIVLLKCRKLFKERIAFELNSQRIAQKWLDCLYQIIKFLNKMSQDEKSSKNQDMSKYLNHIVDSRFTKYNSSYLIKKYCMCFFQFITNSSFQQLQRIIFFLGKYAKSILQEPYIILVLLAIIKKIKITKPSLIPRNLNIDLNSLMIKIQEPLSQNVKTIQQACTKQYLVKISEIYFEKFKKDKEFLEPIERLQQSKYTNLQNFRLLESLKNENMENKTNLAQMYGRKINNYCTLTNSQEFINYLTEIIIIKKILHYQRFNIQKNENYSQISQNILVQITTLMAYQDSYKAWKVVSGSLYLLVEGLQRQHQSNPQNSLFSSLQVSLVIQKIVSQQSSIGYILTMAIILKRYLKNIQIKVLPQIPVNKLLDVFIFVNAKQCAHNQEFSIIIIDLIIQLLSLKALKQGESLNLILYNILLFASDKLNQNYNIIRLINCLVQNFYQEQIVKKFLIEKGEQIRRKYYQYQILPLQNYLDATFQIKKIQLQNNPSTTLIILQFIILSSNLETSLIRNLKITKINSLNEGTNGFLISKLQLFSKAIILYHLNFGLSLPINNFLQIILQTCQLMHSNQKSLLAKRKQLPNNQTQNWQHNFCLQHLQYSNLMMILSENIHGLLLITQSLHNPDFQINNKCSQIFRQLNLIQNSENQISITYQTSCYRVPTIHQNRKIFLINMNLCQFIMIRKNLKILNLNTINALINKYHKFATSIKSQTFNNFQISNTLKSCFLHKRNQFLKLLKLMSRGKLNIQKQSQQLRIRNQ